MQTAHQFAIGFNPAVSSDIPHEFTQSFDPEGVDLFRDFTLVDSNGDSIFEFRPVGKFSGPEAKKVDSIDKRAERVALLTALYAAGEDEEFTPFPIAPVMGVDGKPVVDENGEVLETYLRT